MSGDEVQRLGRVLVPLSVNRAKWYAACPLLYNTGRALNVGQNRFNTLEIHRTVKTDACRLQHSTGRFYKLEVGVAMEDKSDWRTARQTKRTHPVSSPSRTASH